MLAKCHALMADWTAFCDAALPARLRRRRSAGLSAGSAASVQVRARSNRLFRSRQEPVSPVFEAHCGRSRIGPRYRR
jgi:hypothetical protein